MTDLEVDHRRNDQCDWDEFDSNWYFQHNYASVREDDRQILAMMGAFFADNAKGQGELYGLDVGPGANLYPALTMLPFCRSIALWERSAANVAWLQRETRSFRASWDAFWGQLTRTRRAWWGRDREATSSPRKRLAQSALLCHGSVFDLPKRNWDIGTMFFVAESITTEYAEFREATRRFVQSLKPGAPFAAAFMEKSEGYRVGSYHYPAVPVTIDDIHKCLSDITSSLRVEPISSEHHLRDGYSGRMLLALGLAG